MIVGPQDTFIRNKKGRNVIITIKIAEPTEDFDAGKLRLEQEIERFQKGTETKYNTKLRISSIEQDTGIKMMMSFGKAILRVNGELGPGDLANFLNNINNGFDYRGDPEDGPYDPLGVIGFTSTVKQHIRDMNTRIKERAI